MTIPSRATKAGTPVCQAPRAGRTPYYGSTGALGIDTSRSESHGGGRRRPRLRHRVPPGKTRIVGGSTVSHLRCSVGPTCENPSRRLASGALARQGVRSAGGDRG